MDVNTAADDYGVNASTCSLREAIEATNTDLAFGGCAAGTGVDVIVIPNGTYSLTQPGDDNTNVGGDLDVIESDALTIVGTGAVVISSNGVDRVIHHATGGGDLQISNVTITGGNAQGGNDGGGILNAIGNLTMQNSTVQGNRASVDGGGITNYATMTLRNVTISGNSAYNDGGGIYGGGGSTTSLNNVTVAYNTTDVDVLGGGDGGGLGGAVSASFSLFNSLVGDNLDNSSTATMDTNDCGVFGSVDCELLALRGRRFRHLRRLHPGDERARGPAAPDSGVQRRDHPDPRPARGQPRDRRRGRHRPERVPAA